MERIWHGGTPGVRVGEVLTGGHAPALMDGCPTCEKRARGDSTGLEPATGRPDLLYVTTSRPYARFYASRCWLGDLYLVQPLDDGLWTGEDPFPTWGVAGARVVGVYERAVRLNDRQRRQLLRRWPDPGTAGWPPERRAPWSPG